MKFLGKLLVGVLASIGLFIVVIIGAGTYFIMKAEDLGPAAPNAPEKIVLKIDLDEGFVEGATGRRLQGFTLENKITLQDALIAIRRAKDDPRVVGMVANLTEQPLGLAQVQDVRDVIGEFKASGKPTLLYSETIGEGTGALPSYYLAAKFGELWVQPSGNVGVAGLGIEQPFLKSFLDRFGVKANVIQRKEYKSAMENLTNERISPANREALSALLGSFYEQIVTGIANDRSIDESKVRAMIDKGPLLAQEALDAKLIDRIGYRDEFEAEIAKRLPNAEAVEINKYLTFPSNPARPEPKKRVAVINAIGEIARGKSEDSPFSSDDGVMSENFAKAVSDAADDKEIDAILLRIDSPGGSYVASDTIWRELVLAKAKKPIIVSMGNTAASGGYFLAMSADRVFAQPATITGSIGVIMGKLVFAGAFDKLNINWDRIVFGESAGMFSATTEFSPKELARLNELIDAAYADFTTKAAKGRNKEVADLERNARGRVWTGADALKAGLIDELGGFGRAIDYTKEKLGVKPTDTVWLQPYPAPEDPWEKFFKAFKDGGLPFGIMSGLQSLNTLATELAPFTDAGKVLNRKGVQMYAEPIAVN